MDTDGLYTNRVYGEGVRHAEMAIIPIGGGHPQLQQVVWNNYPYDVHVWNSREHWDWDLIGNLVTDHIQQPNRQLLVGERLLLLRNQSPDRVVLRPLRLV